MEGLERIRAGHPLLFIARKDLKGLGQVILAVDCMYTSSNRINTKELVDEDRLLGWRLYKRRCVGRSEGQSVDA